MSKVKIVVACDSFKGSLTSKEAGSAAAEGVRRVVPEAEIQVISVADGGEGTLDALVAESDGRFVELLVTGPMGDKIKASYGICGETAIIEMAKASGLNLVPAEERNPMIATSYGTGELIADAIGRGYRKFLIGLGGSATNDGGIGMLRALGFRFLDKTGNEITNDLSKLSDLAFIDKSKMIPEIRNCSFTAMCDVDAPLTGPEGASYVFGPQKGADAETVRKLDEVLRHLADIASRNCDTDFSSYPGSGAAGGMGFAILAFLNGNIQSGIDAILDKIDFNRKITGASLIITGEGRIDRQTAKGKTPMGILRHATAAGIPVIAIGGSVDKSAVPDLVKLGFKAIIPVTPPDMPIERAMHPDIAKDNIRDAVSDFLQKHLNKIS